jgi:hypothetical protein
MMWFWIGGGLVLLAAIVLAVVLVFFTDYSK